MLFDSTKVSEEMMAVQRKYRCDLCATTLELEWLAEDRRAIGVYWKDWPRGWLLKPAHETERHLCPACIASIQAMPKMCGKGYDCNGGPGCQSDHK